MEKEEDEQEGGRGRKMSRKERREKIGRKRRKEE